MTALSGLGAFMIATTSLPDPGKLRESLYNNLIAVFVFGSGALIALIAAV